jgi:hypothetical protein
MGFAFKELIVCFTKSVEDLRGGGMDANEFVGVARNPVIGGSSGRSGNMGLKGSTFERNVVLEVTAVLQCNMKVGLPLEMGVFKEKHH